MNILTVTIHKSNGDTMELKFPGMSEKDISWLKVGKDTYIR